MKTNNNTYTISNKTKVIKLNVKQLDKAEVYYLGTIEEYLETIKIGNITKVPCIHCKDGLHIQKL